MYKHVLARRLSRKKCYLPSWHGPDRPPVVVIVGDRAVRTVLLLQTCFCLLGDQVKPLHFAKSMKQSLTQVKFLSEVVCLIFFAYDLEITKQIMNQQNARVEEAAKTVKIWIE